jgi:hypothetical protein
MADCLNELHFQRQIRAQIHAVRVFVTTNYAIVAAEQRKERDCLSTQEQRLPTSPSQKEPCDQNKVRTDLTVEIALGLKRNRRFALHC